MARDTYKRTPDIEFERDRLICLGHGCANHATEGKCFCPPIHCCDQTKPPYLLSGKLCSSPLHSNRLFVYTVCCRCGGQCFSVLRTRHTDVVGDSSGRSYVTEQWHNVPLSRNLCLGSTIGDRQTHTHTHTHIFSKTFFDCGSDVQSKIIKKYKSNFLTIAVLPLLFMSLESKKALIYKIRVSELNRFVHFKDICSGYFVKSSGILILCNWNCVKKNCINGIN